MKFTNRPELAVAVTAALLAAGSAFGQVSNTISAKPGALNYLEGTVTVNGNPIKDKDVRTTSLAANDTLETEHGRAEVLLTPGVFLRVGENSEIRMVTPSLTDTQVELTRGEIMVEATGLLKENNLQILDHGSNTHIGKNGLYRFTADNPPLVAVMEGKAEVNLNDQKVDLKKGRETVLADNSLKAGKFDTKQKDDLYAWSDVRSQYDAAASYRVSQNVNSFGYGAYGYGFGPGGFGSGWLWDSAFNSYAWLPYSGAFFSPFGYGFYSPALVGYAPVIIAPGRGYGYAGGYRRPLPNRPGTTATTTATAGMRVPVRPNGMVGSSVGYASPRAFYSGGGGAHPSFSPSAPHAASFGGGARMSTGGGAHMAGGGGHR